MSRAQFFITVEPCYIDPVSQKIVKNPNFVEHFNKYSGEFWSEAETPVKICEGLRLIDGTIANVTNGFSGNEMYRNCETGEVEEFTDENEE